ncbi:hypothetical protein J6590_035460, partial [Homalodisca vitripennis]
MDRGFTGTRCVTMCFDGARSGNLGEPEGHEPSGGPVQCASSSIQCPLSLQNNSSKSPVQPARDEATSAALTSSLSTTSKTRNCDTASAVKHRI